MAVITMASALRAWRELHGWTLADVSGLTGISIGHLSLIERGVREPPPATKVAIAHGVGANVADLFPLEREAVNG
jgi:transcriptional regulator with XRE-family HTH domain